MKKDHADATAIINIERIKYIDKDHNKLAEAGPKTRRDNWQGGQLQEANNSNISKLKARLEMLLDVCFQVSAIIITNTFIYHNSKYIYSENSTSQKVEKKNDQLPLLEIFFILLILVCKPILWSIILPTLLLCKFKR